MHVSKKALISTALGLALLAPVLASAAGLSSTQLNAVTSLLRSFGVGSSTVATVQSTLASATIDPATVPGPKKDIKGCVALLRNISIGTRGEDVKKLQERLNEEDDDAMHVPPTGTFGPMTARAMRIFQERHGVASSTSGSVGPLTRRYFERECGKDIKREDGEHARVGSTTPPRMSSTTPRGPKHEGNDR